MKISYIFQLKEMSIMLIFGLILGIIYGLINIINRIKHNIFIQIIADIIFSLLSITIFLLLISQLQSSTIRIFLVLSYIIGFIIERITLGKIFAKGYKNVYNYIVKLVKWFKKSKIGRIILK